MLNTSLLNSGKSKRLAMIKALKEKQLLMVKSEQEDKHLANKYMILVKDRDFSSNDEIINTLNYLSYQEIGYFADACRALPVHCANK
jgi:dTDP-4-amino-4,6-dideoxygalactose transaminase